MEDPPQDNVRSSLIHGRLRIRLLPVGCAAGCAGGCIARRCGGSARKEKMKLRKKKKKPFR